MRRWLFLTVGVLSIIVPQALLLAGQTGATQSASAASSRTAWKAARTADGHPDLQGMWDFRTVTPLERPAEFANKPFLTEEEAAAYERRIVEERNADSNREESKTDTSRGVINGQVITADVALAYNDFWWDRGTKVVGNRQTSLIVDPPDGRIPALTAEGKRRLEAQDAQRERLALGPEDRSVGERCISGFNSGPPMVPGGYNMNLQVIQAPGYVVLVNEMVHNARIVPLDNRPHGKVSARAGLSRGRWEGETLVVETKNFTEETSLRGSSPNLHLVERFTRVDQDTLSYQFTVSDPTTWTKPWTAQLYMRLTQDQMFEYACHEANYGMTNLLKGARFLEKEAAAKPSR